MQAGRESAQEAGSYWRLLAAEQFRCGPKDGALSQQAANAPHLAAMPEPPCGTLGEKSYGSDIEGRGILNFDPRVSRRPRTTITIHRLPDFNSPELATLVDKMSCSGVSGDRPTAQSSGFRRPAA